MEIITKEQFDNLKVGDTLKNDRYTLIVEAKFAKTIIFIDNEGDSDMLSLKALRNAHYSITKKIPTEHNCGFPFGDYSDKEVIVKVSDRSIEHCEISPLYTRLMSVDNEGFTDHNKEHWMYAVPVLNTYNVDLVK